MNQDIRNRFESKAKIMKAMAHPTRLFIIEELGKQTRCVCELTEMVGADTSTVSKHLSLLRDGGLVNYEKQGNQLHYYLSAPCVLSFFYCLENMADNSFQSNLRCMQCFDDFND